MNKIGVIYARYSCDHQREESIEGQLRECNEYCKKHDIVIIKEYIDRALSAKTDNRPSFQQMIKDSSLKKFDCIIVWKIDRFARNRADTYKYKTILKNNGVNVISATEHISDSAEGIILESVLEGMAEYYSADLSQKVKRGMTENLLKGYFNGGSIPYGYKVQDKKLIVNDDEAIVIKKIFDLYTKQLYSIGEIEKRLSNEKIVNRKGQNFKHGTISSILSNVKYKGVLTFGDQINENILPAIIDKEQFDFAQIRKNERKIAAGHAKAQEKYLLTDKLFCGNCGLKMVGDSTKKPNGKVYKYYVCKSNKKKIKHCTLKPIHKAGIEQLILIMINKYLSNTLEKKKLIDKVYNYLTNENPLIPQLEEKINSHTNKINNLIVAIENGINPIDLKEKINLLTKEREDAILQLNKEKLNTNLLTKEQIEYTLENFTDLDINKEEDAKILINLFIEKVYLYENGTIEIFLKSAINTHKITLSPNSSDRTQNGPPCKKLFNTP